MIIFQIIDRYYYKLMRLYNKVKSLNPFSFFTVNSSPYAHEVYKHLGFVDTDNEQCISGIRFYPMRKILKKRTH